MADNNMFSGLERVGLGMLSNMNLYEDEAGTTAVAVEVAKSKRKIKRLKKKMLFLKRVLDVLYVTTNLRLRQLRQERQEWLAQIWTLGQNMRILTR